MKMSKKFNKKDRKIIMSKLKKSKGEDVEHKKVEKENVEI